MMDPDDPLLRVAALAAVAAAHRQMQHAMMDPTTRSSPYLS